MAILEKRNFAPEILAAIGEDPANVVGLTLYCRPDSAVTIEIDRVITNDEGRKIIETLRKIAWQKVENEDAK